MNYYFPHSKRINCIQIWKGTYGLSHVKEIVTKWKEVDDNIPNKTIERQEDKRKIMNKETFGFC
jgi:hypothetical protein